MTICTATHRKLVNLTSLYRLLFLFCGRFPSWFLRLGDTRLVKCRWTVARPLRHTRMWFRPWGASLSNKNRKEEIEKKKKKRSWSVGSCAYCFFFLSLFIYLFFSFFFHEGEQVSFGYERLVVGWVCTRYVSLDEWGWTGRFLMRSRAVRNFKFSIVGPKNSLWWTRFALSLIDT